MNIHQTTKSFVPFERFFNKLLIKYQTLQKHDFNNFQLRIITHFETSSNHYDGKVRKRLRESLGITTHTIATHKINLINLLDSQIQNQ